VRQIEDNPATKSSIHVISKLYSHAILHAIYYLFAPVSEIGARDRDPFGRHLMAVGLQQLILYIHKDELLRYTQGFRLFRSIKHDVIKCGLLASRAGDGSDDREKEGAAGGLEWCGKEEEEELGGGVAAVVGWATDLEGAEEGGGAEKRAGAEAWADPDGGAEADTRGGVEEEAEEGAEKGAGEGAEEGAEKGCLGRTREAPLFSASE
jgi:hypothetical protein